MFVAELAPDGRVLWAGGAQPGRDFNPPSLARDRDGDIYLAGSLAHETSFGAHEVRPATDGKPAEKSSCRSIYVAKLVRTR